MYVKFIGTGHVVPGRRVPNADFADHVFYDDHGMQYPLNMTEILEKFEAVTGISERRYALRNERASDLGSRAGKLAIEESGIDPNSIDLIIVAHNFGDVDLGTGRSDIVPSLASRVKHILNIDNPDCVPFDVLFGCPGWIQGVLIAEMYLLSGKANRALVVGCETLSRALDPHDRNGMIFADGAGACVMERSETPGILGSAVMNLAGDEAHYLYEGCSYKPEEDPNERFIKMNGRKIYEFALSYVPQAMKKALDSAKTDLKDIAKIFLHQANAKLDHAVAKRLYSLYDYDDVPENIMPMTVGWLGNSSVATVPTLFDLVRKTEYEGHRLHSGEKIIMASVGAGMNINALVYQY